MAKKNSDLGPEFQPGDARVVAVEGSKPVSTAVATIAADPDLVVPDRQTAGLVVPLRLHGRRSAA